MPNLFPHHSALPALGMTSLVLGVIALLLFFLPVLGIPLSFCGILLGVVGVFASLTLRGTHLRYALAGLAISLLAFGINMAITLAPAGYLNEPTVPRLWRPVTDRAFVPPPASQH